METSRHLVSYIATFAFILMYEYSNARPAMDSLYGDHVYSGAIYPISGAVPMKIHSQEKTKETKSQSDAYYMEDSLYGDHVYSGAIYPISGAVPKKIHSNSDTTTDDSNNDTSADGDAYYTEDSLYGDHVYSGAIYPISGAVPKKIHSHNQKGEMKVENSSSNTSIGAEEMKAKKAKKIFDMLGIDLSQINLGQIDGTHKFDGKDSLQPSLCHDTYNDRYGVGKHFIRGVRDVGFAIVSGVEDVLDGILSDLPLVSNINSGIGGGLKAIICAIEDGFSDIGSDADSVIDIAKNGLVDLFKLKGPHPVLDIPVGIAGIAGETVKAAGQLVEDAVGGVKNAVGEILDAL